VLAINIVFAAACAYPLTLVGVWYEDMGTFVISLARTMFFLGPSLVPLSQITGDIYNVVKLNPMTGLFEGYRDALLYGHTPAVWELLYPLGIAAVLLAVFVPLFRHEQQHFAKLV
jgi:ABC-type polysaccharide/polyol phosphate export permease